MREQDCYGEYLKNLIEVLDVKGNHLRAVLHACDAERKAYIQHFRQCAKNEIGLAELEKKIMAFRQAKRAALFAEDEFDMIQAELNQRRLELADHERMAKG
ncbi:MAG: hypothetical protein OEW04_03560 [Nitrospirota bacterium]|nr:hypothetical protein [Nitrospirota bacterium]